MAIFIDEKKKEEKKRSQHALLEFGYKFRENVILAGIPRYLNKYNYYNISKGDTLSFNCIKIAVPSRFIIPKIRCSHMRKL